MPTTLTAGSTTIELSNQLSWLNEFAWTPVQLTTEYSITGAMITQKGVKLSGQPMELGCAGVQRSLVTSLEAIKDFAGEMQLNFRNNTYTVIWDSTPFESTPLKDLIEPTDTDWYTLKINFLIIS